MHVLISSECSVVPLSSKPLVSEGDALLNFLHILDYDSADPPLADLLRRYHHLEGEWLVLSPVHWEATHNDAMIVASGKELQLKEIESKSCFNLFAQYLAEEDKVLFYHNKQTWLLYHDKSQALNAKPVHHLLNLSLMPELAKLDNTMYWQKFFTESQMFFASRTNQSKINGIWLWGSAKLKDKKAIKVCADEYFLSIAQICSSNVTLYSPSVMLKEYEILLITDFFMLSEHHQEELKKKTVDWYWNNVAYTAKSSNWFTRLWRKLSYAN
ncbi:MAG: hypothetical protein HYX60_00410 [Legionella longbeachae]|nr:hypothetical protein [Legionella longbeachae]